MPTIAQRDMVILAVGITRGVLFLRAPQHAAPANLTGMSWTSSVLLASALSQSVSPPNKAIRMRFLKPRIIPTRESRSSWPISTNLNAGVNMHECRHKGISVCWHLNMKVKMQCCGRLVRIGQMYQVEWVFLKVMDSYHDNMERLAITK